MKIYTKTGDNGTTGLYGGGRVGKNDNRVCAYGTIDELNSFMGLLISELRDIPGKGYETTVKLLGDIQNRLFDLGAELACGSEKYLEKLSRRVIKSDTEILEKQIDIWQNELIPLKNFILPGGHKAASIAHVCRSVCRRAEREIIHAGGYSENVTIYINRLSDFLFCLARHINHEQAVTEPEWQK